MNSGFTSPYEDDNFNPPLKIEVLAEINRDARGIALNSIRRCRSLTIDGRWTNNLVIYKSRRNTDKFEIEYTCTLIKFIRMILYMVITSDIKTLVQIDLFALKENHELYPYVRKLLLNKSFVSLNFNFQYLQFPKLESIKNIISVIQWN